jgi:hypothetical protein
MRILSLKEWISEKMKIMPINNDEFDKVGDFPTEDANNGGNGYMDRTLRDFYGILQKLTVNFRANFPPIEYTTVKIKRAAEETEKRFDTWKLLSNPKLLEKHKQRSEKNMTTEKIIATMYCAFRRYRLDPIGDIIIRYYMDRMNKEFNLSDADIIEIFFE